MLSASRRRDAKKRSSEVDFKSGLRAAPEEVRSFLWFDAALGRNRRGRSSQGELPEAGAQRRINPRMEKMK